MKKTDRNALLATPMVVAIGAAFAFAGSDGQPFAGGALHPFALSVLLAFALQWLAFIPSFLKQTEKLFDLVGALSYISIACIAFAAADQRDARSILLLLMVLIWAGRLGSFLFARIHKAGKDDRFDELKKSFWRFLAAWTLQGLWITFTAAAALAAIGSQEKAAMGALTWIGIALWFFGFSFEAIADAQKSRFKAHSDGKRFIQEGLWALSRHPNYFGEIVLWTGVALIAFPVLQGWQYLTLLSPFFVATLLIKVSGIPLLEEKADRRWGGQSEYEDYKRRTPVLIPKFK